MSGTLNPTTPTNRRLAGVASVTIGGVAYNVVDYSWSTANVQRTAMISLSGIDGYSEAPSVSFIQVRLRDARNVNVSNFNAMTDATVVLTLANGKQVVGHNMWCASAVEVSQAEAAFEVRFESATVYETGVSA